LAEAIQALLKTRSIVESGSSHPAVFDLLAQEKQRSKQQAGGGGGGGVQAEADDCEDRAHGRQWNPIQSAGLRALLRWAAFSVDCLAAPRMGRPDAGSLGASAQD
jgi:hypothetical protein